MPKSHSFKVWFRHKCLSDCFLGWTELFSDQLCDALWLLSAHARLFKAFHLKIKRKNHTDNLHSKVSWFFTLARAYTGVQVSGAALHSTNKYDRELWSYLHLDYQWLVTSIQTSNSRKAVRWSLGCVILPSILHLVASAKCQYISNLAWWEAKFRCFLSLSCLELPAVSLYSSANMALVLCRANPDICLSGYRLFSHHCSVRLSAKWSVTPWELTYARHCWTSYVIPIWTDYPAWIQTGDWTHDRTDSRQIRS